MEHLIAGACAGVVGTILGFPLDTLKTRLQTQRFATAAPIHQDAVKACPKAIKPKLKYDGLTDALQSIIKEEGYVGLWRGLVPRVMTHTPAVAITWTTYETAKRWLAS